MTLFFNGMTCQITDMNKLNQNGFTLVEVLISVLVLAVGVIGTAAMQLTALRTAQQSAFQTAAIQLAVEMADTMRANDQQMKLTGDSNPFLAVDYQSATDTAAAGSGTTCYSTNCNAEELAAFDIQEWKTRVKALLPGGRVRICRDFNPWDNAAGAYKWECTPAPASAGIAALVIKIGWHGKGSNADGSAVKDGKLPFSPSVALTINPTLQ
jgi:type IV pilus assembly protein PilV